MEPEFWRGSPGRDRRDDRLRTLRRVAAVLAALALSAACGGDDDGAPAQPPATGAAPVRDPGYTRGAATAPVTVIEFSDFGCTFCRQFALNTYPELHRRYVETGRVRWRYVAFATGTFPNSDRATLAAECAADQGAAHFWAMKDALYETQREWRVPGAGDAHFLTLAARLGIDTDALDACLASDAPRRRLHASNRMASLGGVTGTPAFFVDGRRALGALSVEQFSGLLEAVLAGRAAPAR